MSKLQTTSTEKPSPLSGMLCQCSRLSQHRHSAAVPSEPLQSLPKRSPGQPQKRGAVRAPETVKRTITALVSFAGRCWAWGLQRSQSNQRHRNLRGPLQSTQFPLEADPWESGLNQHSPQFRLQHSRSSPSQHMVATESIWTVKRLMLRASCRLQATCWTWASLERCRASDGICARPNRSRIVGHPRSPPRNFGGPPEPWQPLAPNHPYKSRVRRSSPQRHANVPNRLPSSCQGSAIRGAYAAMAVQAHTCGSGLSEDGFCRFNSCEMLSKVCISRGTCGNTI